MSGTIRLGLLTPLSGLVDIYGIEISNGARIACDEVNESGGINGRELELVIADDGSIPETAVPAAIHLIEDEKCCALIGNLLSNSRIAVVNDVAEPFKIPLLNFSFYEGSISSKYFFNFAALPNQQIDKMIPYMADKFGPKFFFAGSNYEWPLGSIDAAKKSLKSVAGETIGELYLPLGTSDFSSALDAVGKSGADVFVPYFAGNDQVDLLTEFTKRGLKKRMAVVMGHYDEEMVSHLPAEVREGLYSSNTYFMNIKTKENKKVLKRLSALPDIDGLWPKGNGKLTNFSEGAYICVKAFAEAARQAKTLDTDTLISRLESAKVLAPQGTVTIDPVSHHAHVNSYLTRCDGAGEFHIIESFGEIPPIIPERYADHSQAAHVTDQQITPPPLAYDPGDKSLILLQEIGYKETLFRMIETETIYRGADIAILATDSSGTIIHVNPFASFVFGYGFDELVGQSIGVLIPPRFRSQHEHAVQIFAEGERDHLAMTARGELFAYRKDGSEFPAEISVRRQVTLARTISIVTIRDVTALMKSREDLFWQATHDSLTKLPNRALIQERLRNALDRIKRTGKRVALLFIDVDNFKLVNDSYGHDTGDQLLVTVAERIHDAVRAGDTVARFGGDEFVVFCDQVDDTSTIAHLAERISDSLRKPIDVEGRSLSTTVSIGIAFGSSNDRAEDLLRNADGAMYAAKDSGRDGWRIFSGEIHEKAKSHLQIANGLRTAIENAELSLLYQPIIRHADGKIQGVEALLRWHTDTQEFFPNDFIPVAESTGSIVPIGRWVFETAARQLGRWIDKGIVDSDFYLSVNISNRQFTNPRLVTEFEHILFDTEVAPGRILLEITESAIMEDTDHNKKVLQKLGDLGFQIAVDDFGTGYSSLNQLTILPVNRLKIDQVFIQGIGVNEKSEAVVASIIQIAQALKLDVIAEGVETREQLAFLSQAGCDDMQGYLLYHPMEPEEFEKICVNSRTTVQLPSFGA